MCKDCGCSASAEHHQHHHHEHQPRTLDVHAPLLKHNEDHAAWNRQWFQELGIVAVNLMSSPGSGKTLLLERTLEALSGKLRLAVITGDLQTDNDARRLRGKGAPVIPITTGTLCHLEASMVEKACREIELTTIDLLFIENVGNLVCPAAFALGEQLRIVVLSTTEGEDKPLKYPLAFKSADVVIISKTDLAEAAGFQRDTALTNLHFIAPQARVLELSARTGAGLEAWLQLLHSLVASKSAAAVHR